jgi:hypothetical protein
MKRRDYPTQEYLHEKFIYKDGKLLWRSGVRFGKEAGSIAGSRHPSRQIKVLGRLQSTHRLIFLYHHGWLPEVVDHINRDSLDNRIENLRSCNSRENCRNSAGQKSRKSKFKGVWYEEKGNRWRAQLKIEGKRVHLSQHTTEAEAAQAYNEAAIKYHGEFAFLNLVKEGA